MTRPPENRTVIPVREEFFNDGHWYVLTSTSLGGGQLSLKAIADQLQSDDPADFVQLLENGICLPLCFPADCCLDNAVIVVGDLTAQEKQAWLGRIQSVLEIPCGEFVLMGGGIEEDFEIATQHFAPPNPHFQFFQKVRVPPGRYLVEVYAFIGSIIVTDAWDANDTATILKTRWQTEHPSEPYPDWLTEYLENGYVDAEKFDFLEYLIRLQPFTDGDRPPLPTLGQWCDEFTIRQPITFPIGLSRSHYGKLGHTD
ncbi:hypothetical protein NIES970_16630 [[Synechococcus] sp. NIES-970]|nr:hypothetical protein NIES970_16630 [[Synechococcus] sp. NIES-970]